MSIAFLFLIFQIIPPGVEFGHIIHDFEMDGEEENPCPASEDPPIWSQVTALPLESYRDLSY